MIKPNVFVVSNEYHIVVNTKKDSQIFLQIAGKKYYEDNCGILPISKIHKIKIKQSILDNASKYQIIVKNLIKKEAYDTKFENDLVYEFKFKTPPHDTVKMYFIGDVHGFYEEAKKAAKKAKYDVFVFGGDFGEAEKERDIVKFNKFLFDVTKGELPIIYVRGNHDTRGRYADNVYKYVGMNEKIGYFKFQYSFINGMVLDCGEDKNDDFWVYGSANIFEKYRAKETNFIKSFESKSDMVNIAFSHIGFCLNSSMHHEFDICNKTYQKWADILNKKQLALMLCAHIHRLELKEAGCDKQIHNYPILTPTSLNKDYSLNGALITITKESIDVLVNSSKNEDITKFQFKI